MPHALRSNLDARRSRIAQAATIGGSLAIGTLVVGKLVELFREDFFLYYGVSERQYDRVGASADAAMPLTLGQLTLAGIATFFVVWFIYGERRRLRQEIEIADACRSAARGAVTHRLSSVQLMEEFVSRTSLYAGVLWLLWVLQACAERWFGGLGWGLEYVDLRGILPLASVFGLAVLAAMVVALISMVGLRAIHVLELVRCSITRLRRTRIARPAWVTRAHEVRRTFRELLGCDILSRPPPVMA